ncbi:redoxin domain-containing protein [Chitinophaga sp. 22620]|uniref:redoxin domain-containing protein n=1 Tax=Chitinophaga sp. 22620 TaxID=3453952 RepID=UPI003F82E68D
MKKLILAAVLISPAAVLLAQDKKTKNYQYHIEGSIADANQEKPAKYYLRMRTAGVFKMDSAIANDGKFSFTGEIPEPQLAQIFAMVPGTPDNPMGRKEVALIFLGKGTTQLNLATPASKAEAGGTHEQGAFNELNDLLRSVNKDYETAVKKYRDAAESRDEDKLKKAETRLEQLEASKKAVMRKYLEDNPETPIGMYVLNQVAGYELNPDEVEPLFNSLSRSVRKYPSAKEFEHRVELARKLAVGQPAIDFNQRDAAGNPVTLASFRGKYVLVDFWASWCGPCRAENPNVVKAFNRFKEKGFTILGVSFDERKDKWQQAIEQDGLTWTHVSDLRGWGNEVGKLYGIRAIPQNVLVDPEGKIIARNLRAEDLNRKLEELLK